MKTSDQNGSNSAVYLAGSGRGSRFISPQRHQPAGRFETGQHRLSSTDTYVHTVISCGEIN